MNRYNVDETAEQIKTLFFLSCQIPEDAINRVISDIDTKVSGSVIFMAMGENIDFEELAKRKKRAEALLNLIKVLKETEE